MADSESEKPERTTPHKPPSVVTPDASNSPEFDTKKLWTPATPDVRRAIDPHRACDWRYSRVLELLDSNRMTRDPWGRPRYPHLRKTDDDYVRALREYLLAYRRRKDIDHGELIGQKYPLLDIAYKTRTAGDRWMSDMIEAAVLSGLPNQAIAFLAKTDQDVVHVYQKLFFDVKDHLKHRYWILQQIYRNQNALSVPEEATVVRLFAYFFGPITLDFFATGFTQSRHLESMDELPEAMTKFINQSIRRRVAMTVNAVEVNKYNMSKVYELHTKLIELDRSDQSESKAKSMFDVTVSQFLTTNTWALGLETGEEVVPKAALALQKQTGRVLRDNELHHLARTGSLAQLTELLETTSAFTGREAKKASEKTNGDDLFPPGT